MPSDPHSSQKQMPASSKYLESQVTAPGSLVSFSFRHRWWVRFLIVFISLAAAISGILGPLFQKIFVDHLLGQTSANEIHFGIPALEEPGPAIAVAFIATLLAQALGLLANFVSVKEGVRLQRIFGEALYKKMLSIRPDSLGSTTVGEVVSVFATDVAGATAVIDQAIPMAASILFPMVFAPLAVYWLCGFPVWGTLALMSVIVAINIVLGTRQSRFFYNFKQLAAERTGIVNEWVQNIRLLRILGWTESFELKIFNKRVEETRNRVAMVTNGQTMGSIGSSISFFINLTGVAALVFLSQQPIQPGQLFALLWIFGVFLARPFRQIPWIFTFTLDSLSSMRRLESFLHRKSDAGEPEGWLVREECPEQSLPLKVRGLNLSINGNHLLRGIDFDVKAGEFVAVVGEVGSGKSLFVSSLVGETGATFESFKIGDVDALGLEINERRQFFAFVPQEGFVMSASLRENIVFHYEPPRERDPFIEKSLALAQFKIAQEQLSDGLDTEIGERGTNLSGGQRQRVSLARAHHFERPVVLLDDCLSAVDVDTEKHLVHELIAGAWKNRTRVLVTHRLSVLELVDRVLFMEAGRIIDQGTLTELLARSAKMRDYVASVRRQEETKAEERKLDGANGEQKTAQA